MQAVLHDGAEGLAVDINGGFATRIVVTKLGGSGAAEGVAEDSYPGEVEVPVKFTGQVGSVYLLQAIEDESDVRGPGGQDGIDATGLLRLRLTFAKFGVILGASGDYAAIGKGHYEGAVRSVETDNDVAVAGQIFGQGGV